MMSRWIYISFQGIIISVLMLFHPLNGSDLCTTTQDDGKVTTICFGSHISSLQSVGIQSDVQILYIDDAKFDFPVLHHENFTHFRNLEVIRIKSSKISRIFPNTFSGLEKLNFIDLSENEIKRIVPGAFNHVSLSDLLLNGNKGINLDNDTFRGSKIDHLYMKNCELEYINYETIKTGRIKNLTISNNNIKTLDSQFIKMLQPTHSSTWGYLDVSENPLRCDCDLVWLSEFMIGQERENIHRDFRSDSDRLTHQLTFTCYEPNRLARRKLPLDSETICPSPKIIGVDLDIIQEDPLLINLVCQAKALSISTITMIDDEGYQISSKDPKPRILEENGIKYFISRSQMNMTISNLNSKKIKCVATDHNKHFYTDSSNNLDSIYNKENLNSVRINIKSLIDKRNLEKMIAKNLQLSSSTTTPSIIDGEFNQKSYNNLFVKRYTLLELVGSIVGTFIGTLLFLYCISRCLPIVFKTTQSSKRSSSPENSDAYLKNSKSLLISSGNHNGKNLSKNSPEIFLGSTNDSGVFDSSQFQNTFTQIQKNPQYWPTPEYTYSTTATTGPEYDIPRVSNNLPTSEANLSVTLSRRGLLPGNANQIMQSPLIIPTNLGQPQSLYHPNIFSQAANASPALLNAANFYNLQSNLNSTLLCNRSNNSNLLNNTTSDNGPATIRNSSNSPSSGGSINHIQTTSK